MRVKDLNDIDMCSIIAERIQELNDKVQYKELFEIPWIKEGVYTVYDTSYKIELAVAAQCVLIDETKEKIRKLKEFQELWND